MTPNLPAAIFKNYCIVINTQGAQIATRLSRHCSGPACSQRSSTLLQPAGWYWPTAYGPIDRHIAYDNPYRHKTQHMVGMHLRAKFCRRTTRCLGGDRPQTK